MGAYLYGDLSPVEMREVRLHTQDCSECREDLRERGQIIASLGDGAPMLNDDERQSIAWSVQGAVRLQEQERQYSRFRLAPAYVIVFVLAVGLVVGSTINARMGSHQPDTARQLAARENADKDKTQDKARVEITEERIVKNDDPKDKDDDKTSRISEEVIQAINKTLLPAINTGAGVHRSKQNTEREDSVKPDDPAPIVPHNEAERIQEQSDKTQLPKPQDINDAQTTTETTNNR